ncbi:glucosamine-6-phosphate deaminase [Cohnella abietis]|uniref:Glucosamine-6-phosphate deaminase n=1 Tax=Cohnella abietis TaxID=2507935 RepID=A0A3T1CZU2_9BACL|nr:glucosamine-6-phosphate deaminase [Cohnella abietis]BBI31387.1 glucosamine-6-phosphate deaminase 1 [Cohnella abietis]
MRFHILPTAADIHEQVADQFCKLLSEQPFSKLGLATGSTPIGIYTSLVRRFRAGEVSFRNATSFNLDEYVGISEDHPESYHSYMDSKLFQHIDLAPGSSYLPNGNATDLQEECSRYDNLLRDAGRIDLQLVGIGHNGHIGFNEPGRSLRSGTHLVKLDESTRQANARFFDRIEDVPTQALTMGMDTILKARTVLLVVTGADKAATVHRALTGPIETECPASLLQLHPDLHVYMDVEAGLHFTE